MIGLPAAHNESRERFAWQRFDLLTKGKHTVGSSYSRGDVTQRYSLGLVLSMCVGLM